MKPESVFAGSWAVPLGGELVTFGNADAVLLLTAASGLAGALVHAGDIALALKVANAYLRMSVDQGGSPISALTRVTTPARAFSGVCVTDALEIGVERESLSIPVRLIRSITASLRKQGWGSAGRATVELIDGSIYKHVQVKNPRLSVLTVLGCQNVEVVKPGVEVRGHAVPEIAELRDRLEVMLERHQPAFHKTIGLATFERFFCRAA